MKSENNKNHNRLIYPQYWELEECLTRYNAKDPDIIRSTLRGMGMYKNAASYCTCDRKSQANDVRISGALERNRALDGDQVFVELLPLEEGTEGQGQATDNVKITVGDGVVPAESWWQQDDDDAVQVRLWDPVVPIPIPNPIPDSPKNPVDADRKRGGQQRRGRVVHVLEPPCSRRRVVVGTLKRLPSGGNTLLTPANQSLTQFRLNDTDARIFRDSPSDAIFSATYVYGSWKPHFQWPPCEDVVPFGRSGNVQAETTALLIDNHVDHGEFPRSVVDECQHVLSSSGHHHHQEQQQQQVSGWKPTLEMCSGRADFRHLRIFTIDPTNANDLEDALHIRELSTNENDGDGSQIEVGVHISDTSHFIQPNSMLDIEAKRRSTTVYLVDRTIPMLPLPLCEDACSLIENVDRLTVSCVWRMNRDGTLVKGHKVWFGWSVIKSCARLDYATAQNIIDKRVACGGENQVDDEKDLWPVHRRPASGTHNTMEQVAADVRLLHEVGMARRELRFQNGALALDALKLKFSLDTDGTTPLFCEPDLMQDSNFLVEEYMLLANYFVAQRLITHATIGGKALLRNHPPPRQEQLEKVVRMVHEAIGFSLDSSSSEALQQSLDRLGQEYQDELVVMTVTDMLKVAMQAANYIVAGSVGPAEWKHYSLNIPYYTHFTSPVRRYADLIVHRLLQATLDKGPEAVDDFYLSEKDMNDICEHCNEKNKGASKAQQRSDILFLALYLRRNPLKSKIGIVVSVGVKTFTVFVPSLGISALVFLDEHNSWIKSQPMETASAGREILITRIARHHVEVWTEFTIKCFAKIRVCCMSREGSPIGVKLELEGPWTEDAE